MSQGGGHLGELTVRQSASHVGGFADYLLGAVVGVQSPAVVTGVSLGRVLAHDLRTGDRLTLGEGVAIADVEDERGRLAHGLDTDEVVSDQLGVGLADEGEGKPGEVSDIRRGGLVFENHRTVGGIPSVELVLKDGCHQAELLLRHFFTLVQDGRPLANQLVLLRFVKNGCLVEVSDGSLRATVFNEVALGLALQTILGLG